jgi:hypothetical protein
LGNDEKRGKEGFVKSSELILELHIGIVHVAADGANKIVDGIQSFGRAESVVRVVPFLCLLSVEAIYVRGARQT